MNEKMKRLMHAVISNSEADDWKHAVKEWQITSSSLADKDDDHSCVCGQEGLLYLYEITNQKTGSVLFPIGSECIKKFKRSDMNEQVKVRQQLLQLGPRLMDIAKANRAGKFDQYQSGYYVPFVSSESGFSNDLIEFLDDHDVLKASVENGWNPEDDYYFLMRAFQQRNPLDREKIVRLNHLLSKSVFPWLRQNGYLDN